MCSKWRNLTVSSQKVRRGDRACVALRRWVTQIDPEYKNPSEPYQFNTSQLTRKKSTLKIQLDEKYKKFKMLKFVLLAVLVVVVESGDIGFGYGHGGYGGYGAGPYHLGYGFVAAGHGGKYHRPGVAKVQVQQNPFHYNYAVNEHGPGYNKYINQAASFGYGGYGAY